MILLITLGLTALFQECVLLYGSYTLAGSSGPVLLLGAQLLAFYVAVLIVSGGRAYGP